MARVPWSRRICTVLDLAPTLDGILLLIVMIGVPSLIVFLVVSLVHFILKVW